jgi:hypothetical protein
MATAKKIMKTERVERVVVEEKQVLDHVELKLTMEEAKTIYGMVGRAIGDCVKSPRKHANAIYYALLQALGDCSSNSYFNQILSNIEFKNFKD